MMDTTIVEGGVIATFCLLVIREILAYTSRKSRPGSATDLVGLEHKVDQIWHTVSREDQDGVPMVYTRRSLQESIDKLSVAVACQTRVLELLLHQLEPGETRP